MNQPNPAQTQIKLDIDPKDVPGIYSNLAFLHLSASEFIVDFARIMPGPPMAKVHSRIIMTPQTAKAVLALFEQNVKKYEEQNGEIKIQTGQSNNNAIGFQSAEGTDEAKS
jgi:hypothetical protein